VLIILDGSKALHTAVRHVFDRAALIQRCQVHKLRNILDHLPERQRPWVQAVVRRAYQASDVKTATRLLTDLARRLEDEYPSAAGSVRPLCIRAAIAVGPVEREQEPGRRDRQRQRPRPRHWKSRRRKTARPSDRTTTR